jgi:hypothetical protein
LSYERDGKRDCGEVSGEDEGKHYLEGVVYFLYECVAGQGWKEEKLLF